MSLRTLVDLIDSVLVAACMYKINAQEANLRRIQRAVRNLVMFGTGRSQRYVALIPKSLRVSHLLFSPKHCRAVRNITWLRYMTIYVTMVIIWFQPLALM